MTNQNIRLCAQQNKTVFICNDFTDAANGTETGKEVEKSLKYFSCRSVFAFFLFHGRCYLKKQKQIASLLMKVGCS
jgi:hypothetical protein